MIESKYSLENYGVVEGIVKTDGQTLATVTLQALRMNEENNFKIF